MFRVMQSFMLKFVHKVVQIAFFYATIIAVTKKNAKDKS